MTHVAFLRAINVGGRGIVRMADVQEAFTRAGCRNVRTVIASGNVLFDLPRGTFSACAPRIGGHLARLFGGQPVVIYRSADDVRRLVARAPFGPLTTERALKLYVMFAVEKTSQRPRFPLALPKEGLEALGMCGADVFIVSRRKPNGWYGFPTLWIEKELGITTTARSWSTVLKVAAHGTGRSSTGGQRDPIPRAR